MFRMDVQGSRRMNAVDLRLAGSMAGIICLLLLGVPRPVQAQQLEPRAYSPAPVDLNIAGLAALFTTGNVVTDPASPVQNIQARVLIAAPYYGRTLGLLGRLASVTVTTPAADADVTGDVYDVGRSIDRTGMDFSRGSDEPARRTGAESGVLRTFRVTLGAAS
jgi:hypothetical protein